MSCGCDQGCGSRHCACLCHCAGGQLEPPANEPGRETVRARLGAHGDFFRHGLRELGAGHNPALNALGTRDLDDPTIAWLDAWAMAADVITFYRERLTNDSYLRTARDERALRELAALTGYQPRPGVAATAHLAYLLDKSAAPVEIDAGAKAQSVPLPGEQMQTFETDEKLQALSACSEMRPRLQRVRSLPLVEALLTRTVALSGSVQFASSGERLLFVYADSPGRQVMREIASAKLDVATSMLNVTLKPRAGLAEKHAEQLATLCAQAVAANNHPIDGQVERAAELLDSITSYFLGGSADDASARLGPLSENNDLVAVIAKSARGVFEEILHFEGPQRGSLKAASIETLLPQISRLAPRQPASSRALARTPHNSLVAASADRYALLAEVVPSIAPWISNTLDNLPANDLNMNESPSVYILRLSAGAFGSVSPARRNASLTVLPDPPLVDVDRQYASLDVAGEGVLSGSLLVFDRPTQYFSVDDRTEGVSSEHSVKVARVRSARTLARSDYGVQAKSLRMTLTMLDGKPLKVVHEPAGGHVTLRLLRDVMYFAQSDPVSLAREPDPDLIEGDTIELDGRIDGMRSGRWIIVAGERADIRDPNDLPVRGVRGGELAMIASISHQANELVPGDTPHTVLRLVTPLGFSYRRDSVTIYGNVARASHGETVSEVLGSGDARAPAQRFDLTRPPLTFRTASTPAGAASTETLRVNGLRYRRVDSLLDACPRDRVYQLELNEKGAGKIICGDGVNGARLPSGPQNVQVSYRTGIGAAGNVKAGQINLLTTRPLGVNGVLNPLAASGGAERDDAERIRRNCPIAARALAPESRLVSVADYAAFAQRFAGIGQAVAAHLDDGRGCMVHVTIAGVGDVPIDPAGELIGNLYEAYRKFGDPVYGVRIDLRELLVLVLQARVALLPEASWELVEPRLRAGLLESFGIERRALGQSACLSEVVAILQKDPAVAWVDVDLFGSVSEAEIRSGPALENALERLADDPLPACVLALPGRANPDWPPKKSGAPDAAPQAPYLPAQIALFSRAVPDLLVLNESKA